MTRLVYLWLVVLLGSTGTAIAQSSRPGWGATPYADAGGTGVTFRTWAPNAASVTVAGSFNGWNTGSLPLISEGGGVWSRDITTAAVGHPYKFVINGTLWRRDPYSKQLEGTGTRNSIIHNAAAFAWGTNDFVMPPPNELVIYEMHIGAFYDPLPLDGLPGKFTNAIQQLDHLVDLGINAIELMPISEFPTATSWGYNLSYPFAIESTYGTPDQLKALIKACHDRGIAVLMDVVHNHWGDDSDDWSLWQYDGWSTGGYGGIYFYSEPNLCCTWWGPRPDYSRPEVRDYILNNFRMWKQDYRIDGFRWDAPQFMLFTDNTQAIPVPDASNAINYVIATLSNEFEHTFHIAEDIKGVVGFNSHWDMAYQGTMQGIMSTGEDNNRNMSSLAGAINGDPNRIIYTESHDTTGDLNNWAVRFPKAVDGGDAEGYYARKRTQLASVFTLTAPGTPMIWMGQELLETNLFSDVRSLDWSRTNTFAHITRFYRDLIHLRRNLDGVSGGLAGDGTGLLFIDSTLKTIGYRRYHAAAPDQDVVVIANLRNSVRENYTVPMPAAGTWYIHVNTDAETYGPDYENVGVAPSVIASGNPPTASVSLGRYSAMVLSQIPSVGLSVEALALDDASFGNANGRVDPGETVLATVSLLNRGQIDLPSVQVAMASDQSGIAVNQPQTVIPWVPAQASASAVTPFVFQVATNWSCGEPIEFDLRITSGGIDISTREMVGVGTALIASVETNGYASANVPVAIIDNQSVFSDLVITNQNLGGLESITVWLRIDHTWNSDMVIALQHPDGSEVVLANRRGGGGDNYGTGLCGTQAVYTTFDMQAATAIASGVVPFAGRFVPDGNLDSLVGKPVAGTWRLRITDLFGADQGTLRCWGISVAAPSLNRSCDTVFSLNPDADGDGLPDWWEITYYGNPTNAIAGLDDDDDGYTNEQEFLAATDPVNTASYLRVETRAMEEPLSGVVIRWDSAADRRYRLWRASALNETTFQPIASNIPATPTVNTYIDASATGSVWFYRIELE
jgi:1,4-alpha-glucan branching enzyme